jgi:hypothetical protein
MQSLSDADTFAGKFSDLNDGTFASGYFSSDPDSGWIAHPLPKYVLDKE